MSAPDYFLRSINVVYTARLRTELTKTIENLGRTLDWTTVPYPIPRRLPRRALRITYGKSPYKHRHTIKHYVFQDWRYSFTFYDVKHPRVVVSAILGSMTSDVCCTCHFAWRFNNQDLQNNKVDKISSSCGDKADRIRNYIEEDRIVEKITQRVELGESHWFNKKFRWPAS
eukprot:GHVQ01004056.1.p1 GENE.GHVQ01004056.1~~GHVQ01004056.1.p1  ORF type:complete len:171 (+),score=9.68 GHVQ01004056.1:216-728(+)